MTATDAVMSGDHDSLYHRLGELTRTLHDALRELGYDRSIEEAVSNLPEARSRLSYIARLTGDAAEKVLNSVDAARQDQDHLAVSAQALEDRLRRDPVRAVSGGGVLNFVHEVQGHCERTNAHLTEIMMAQDFHDLTGQVTRKLVEMVQRMESDLLGLLLEAAPVPQNARRPEEGLAGPVIETDLARSAGADVLVNQTQVDDLLESLGF